MMTTLLYRGQNYVQPKEQKAQKDCFELTYRCNHYNTCRSDAKSDLNSQLAYRGQSYQHQFDNFFYQALLVRAFFFAQMILSGIVQLFNQAKLIIVSPHKLCMQMLLDGYYILCPKTHLQFHWELCKRSHALFEYHLMHF